MNISELKNNMGVHSVLCNVEVKEGITQTKKPYLRIIFSDSSQKQASINVWDDNPKYEEYKKMDGSLALASLEFAKVNGKGYEEYILHDIELKERPSLINCVDIPALTNELTLIFKDNVHDVALKNILYNLWNDDCLKKKLLNAPASEKTGYSFKGGLLARIVRMCKLAIAISDVYNSWNFNKGGFVANVNKELLIICCTLSEIGKIEALEFDGEEVKKTFKGELLGDAVCGNDIVNKLMENTELVEEQRIFIQHCLISSKGKPTYGALVVPRTKEANVFHNISRLDAVMGNFEFMDRTNLGGDFMRLFDKQYCLVSYDEI